MVHRFIGQVVMMAVMFFIAFTFVALVIAVLVKTAELIGG